MKSLLKLAVISSLLFSPASSFAEPLAVVQNVRLVVYNKKHHLRSGATAEFVLRVLVNEGLESFFEREFIASPGVLADDPRPGFEPLLTPEGTYHPTKLFENYVSKQFGGKFLGMIEIGEMPYTMFFHKGFAIHGSAGTVDGFPASKGCVRLRVPDARKVFSVVKQAIQFGGAKQVKIEIHHTESRYMKVFRREMLTSTQDQNR